MALWNRIADFAPERFDEALNGFRVVRSTLMRLTLHQVHADDYRAFREAMEPTLRGGRLHDPRFRAAGFTAADADALLPGLLAHAAEARTGAELRELVERGRSGPVAPVVWRMVRQYAPLWHAPTGPPWSFGTAQSFVAAAERPVLADPEASAAGLAVLLRRYLEVRARVRGGHGAVHDGAPAPGARGGADPGRGLVRLEGPTARSCTTSRARRSPTRRPRPAAPARHVGQRPPRVRGPLPDHPARVPQARDPGERRHAAGAPRGRVRRRGLAAGRGRDRGLGLPPAARRGLGGLAAEASALGGFLPGRDPLVYRRYDHWWAKGFPAVETRVLPAG